MVTSPYFLRFMNDALEMYRYEEKVISIHGYCYPVHEKLPKTFFLPGADCWGWATWERGWDLFEPDGKKLLSEFKTSTQKRAFNINNSFPFYKMLKDQTKGKIDSWAIRWNASAFLAGKLTLWPGHSLVKNIGLDNSGSHCGNQQLDFGVELSSSRITMEKVAISESLEGREILCKYFKSIKIPFHKKCVYKLKYLLKKLI